MIRIKEARELRGMSQKKLANALNIKPTTFNGYETGAHDPRSDILKIIAQECNVSIDYLLGLTENPEPQTKKSPVPAEAETREILSNVFPIRTFTQEEKEADVRDALLSFGLITEGRRLTSCQIRIVSLAFQLLTEALSSEMDEQENAG